MAKLIHNNHVVYVEPNIENDFSAYNSENRGTVYKSVDLSDMSILVRLEVEVKGRTYETGMSSNEKNVMTMSWQSSVGGDKNKITFSEGTKIKTANRGDIYSYTTNYTDIFLSDIEENGTSEMFGINSIDISYNNFMVPEVVIQFIDVRGVSLFASEEMRHHISNGVMDGLVDNNIEGSFFKAFFTFPYPKFTLFVKGFYGQMVSYELTCSDFRSAFDSNTGNFRVTAKFIGYAYSFLTDIMVNGLVAAPYCEYIGKEYWEKNVEETKKFVLIEPNKEPVKMQKLGYICNKYKKIQEDVAKSMGDGLGNAAREAGMSEEKVKQAENADDVAGPLNELINSYDTFMSILQSASTQVMDNAANNEKSGDCVITRTNGQNSISYVFITDEKVEILEDILEKKPWEEINKQINDITGNAALTAWKGDTGHEIKLIKHNDFDDIFDKQSKHVISGVIKDENLRKAVDEKGSKHIIGNDGKTYYEAWVDSWLYDSSAVYIYEDFGLGNILNSATEDASQQEQQNQTLTKEVEGQLFKKKFEEVFHFMPSVENITKIIMAHVETFVYMVNKCSGNIINAGAQRSLKNLGLGKEYFPDIGINRANGVTEDTIVAPFPKVTNVIDDGSRKKNEEEWIGSIEGATRDKFEEIKLVESILNAIGEAERDGSASEGDVGYGSQEGRTSIAYPLTFFDLFLGSGDDVLGSNLHVNDINDLFARFCVRAFSVMATQGKRNVTAKTFGMVDAENFLIKHGGDVGLSSIAGMLSTLSGERVFNFVSRSDNRIDDSKKSNPWYKVKSLIEKVGDNSYKLAASDYGSKRNIFPTKNWTFNEMSSKVNRKNAYELGKSGIVDKNFGNHYITSTCLSDDGDDDTAVVMEIREASIKFFQNSYAALADCTHDVTPVFSITNGFSFEKEKLRTGGIAVYDSEGKRTYSVMDLIDYDENGNVSSVNGCAIDFRDFFLNEEYVHMSQEDRAAEFLKLICDNKNVNTYNIIGDQISTYFITSKVQLLNDGARLFKNKNIGIDLRPSIKKKYIDYFKNWVNTDFGYIDEKYRLVLTGNIRLKDLNFLLKSVDYDYNKMVEVFKKCLDETTFATTFKKLYEVTKNIETLSSNKIILHTRPCNEMDKVVKDLLKVVSVCTLSKFNMSNERYMNIGGPGYLSNSDLIGYFDGVIDILKQNVRSDAEDGEESTEVSINSDPDDIKIGVYAYLKLLYDKWLASGNQINEFDINTLFGQNGDRGPVFHFIDSVYENVGQNTFLNLESLVKRIEATKTQSGYNLLNLLSGVYADNRFLLLCIQNFMDFSKDGCIDRMFEPIPYIEHKEPNNQPNFIVLMPYEPSSHLDIEGADYQDDTFYLNDPNTANLPELIRNKSENGMPIPAFGVCYGQQYQNYFKNVQVDMNAPMVTEQSIKAKFLIAGANSETGNNGSQVTTIGQDLYTIYANNSYTCTVTMMGCAWVQPMMYFVLQNIPMFRGSYMIVKVNHQIHPGNMTTTFTGIRMAKSASRAVKDPFYGGTVDASSYASGVGGAGGEYGSANQESSNADVSNDCPYAYNDPVQREVKIPTNGDKQAYCYAAYQILTKSGNWFTYNGVNVRYPGLTHNQAMGVLINMQEESHFVPTMAYLDTNSIASVGICAFYTKRDHKGWELYEFAYGREEGERRVIDVNNKLKSGNKVGCDVPFETQMKYVCYRIETEQRYREIYNCTTLESSTNTWTKTFCNPHTTNLNRWKQETEGHVTRLQWVESALEAKRKIQMQEEENKPSSASTDDIAEGLRKSVEGSLNTSQYHKDTTVTMEKKGDYYIYKASGDKQNNALFDCFINTYSSWFDVISWDVGNQTTNSDAKSVTLHVVKTKPSSHTINVTAVTPNGKSVANITKDGEINGDFRKSLEKYFKNNNVTTGAAAKSMCKSVCSVQDKKAEEWFGLDGEKQVSPCQSTMGAGGASYQDIPIDKLPPGFAGTINNPLMKAVLFCGENGDSYCTRIESPTMNNKYSRYHITKEDRFGCCTSGPSTWYNQAWKKYKDVIVEYLKSNVRKTNYHPENWKKFMDGDSWWSPCRVKTSTVSATESYLQERGFELVWQGTKETALQMDKNRSDYFRPGDIVTLHAKTEKGGPTSHGEMWNGKDWRSDFIQNGIWVYGKNGGRTSGCNGQTASLALWRHPLFQEDHTSEVYAIMKRLGLNNK